jgi:hypothetical protein
MAGGGDPEDWALGRPFTEKSKPNTTYPLTLCSDFTFYMLCYSAQDYYNTDDNKYHTDLWAWEKRMAVITAGTCCSYKIVGGTFYSLVEENFDWTDSYDCKDACVYQT